jgi:hypothetical protein
MDEETQQAHHALKMIKWHVVNYELFTEVGEETKKCLVISISCFNPDHVLNLLNLINQNK